MSRETSDALRVLSMLAVCAIHATARFEWRFIAGPGYCSADGVAVVVNQLSRFAVPAFIFLSGLALATKYRERRAEVSWVLCFYRDRLVKIGIPYFGWTVALEIWSGKWSVHPSGAPWWSPCWLLATDLIRGGADYHFYFFPILFQCYLLFPLLLRWNDALSFALLLLLSFTFASPAHHLASQFGVMIPFVPAYAGLYWLVYFHLGILVATHSGLTAWLRLRPASTAIAAGAAAVAVLAEYSFWSRHLLDPGHFNHFHRWTVLFYALACLLALAANDDSVRSLVRISVARPLSVLASVSFLGFLAHTNILRLIEQTAWKEYLTTVLLFQWAAVIGASMAAYYIIQPDPLRLLLGLPARRPRR